MICKFRGLHEHTGIWITGGMEYIEAKELYTDDRAYIVNRGFRTEVKPNTLSITTGKYDCDGDEIFDGDIVAITLELDGELQPTEYYLVEFDENEGRFKTKILNFDLLHQDDINFLEDCKIVGNKWETPELLKQAV